jgi:transmembrane sensor
MTQSSSTIIEFKPARRAPPTTAEGWCARLHADDVSEQDRQAFQEWLKTSPDHRAEYELSALTFQVARGLADAPDLRASFSNLSREPRAPARKYRARSPKWLAAAAVLFGVCLTSLLILYLARADYATDVGEQRLVSLSDGTTIQLNTASAIQVDVNVRQRQVTLSRGEAFFNVTQDPTRPFIVKVGTGKIQVLGTKFNVRLDGRRASVAVLEGRVKVDGVDLHAGEGAKLTSETAAVKLPKINAAKMTSWREGKIYFDHDPLSKVLQEVNRYTETPFVVDEPDTARLTLSGVFRTGDVDSVAFALRETYGLKTERVGAEIRVR